MAKKVQKENSPTHILGFELISGDMNANVAGLMEVLQIKELSEIEDILSAFKINSKAGVHTTPMDENRRKTGLFLLALAARYQKDVFTLNASDVSLIWKYFPDEVIKDVCENPDTKHSSVYQLLSGGTVIVTILRKKS